MSRCPITYEPIEDGSLYSPAGLKLLNRRLARLEPLAYSAEQQREEAVQRSGKMSVQGVQLKLSAVLRVTEGRFKLVDRNGRFLLKPPSLDFPEMPENEDLTMRLAAATGIQVPQHGLLYARDNSLTYFVKRFDRTRTERIAVEDFAQLSGGSRETKYDSSMEKVAAVIDAFCTFPAIERVKLFERTLFSFLVGSEDMHLKNFSLIVLSGHVVLAPGYDFINSSIILKQAKEEMALPIRGKRAGLTKADLFDYYARERLQISDRAVNDIIAKFGAAFPKWFELIEVSFLSDSAKRAYVALAEERKGRLGFN